MLLKEPPFRTVTYFSPFLFKPYATQNFLIRQGQTSIPAKARKSAYLREIVGDRVPISIVKMATKKAFFLPFLLRKTELLCFLSVKSV